ncbi:unnamed protein product [Clonostachys rosea]|uniref:Uncharacterized protein n=1 Tax=Bionectria ochroleuca TaxID=29856 RepID=A0ABY6UGY2_BIOOC|nr:unnamed protein product [Clonostachys rosea]
MAPSSLKLGNADIAICISAESVQAQIEALYDTQIETQEEEDGTHFVIPHVLNTDSSPENSMTAYFDCPKIDFSGDTMLKSNISKYTTARISFKFRKNPYTEEDSELMMWKFEPAVKGKKQTITPDPYSLNDYTLSWDINIGLSDIQEILSDIVKRGSVPGPASAILSKYIDSRVFTVSSLFCSFQSSQMASSFALRDPAGNLVRDKRVEDKLLIPLTTLLRDEEDGTPNKTNPFILGYTIAQSSPQLSDVNKAAVNPAPEFFVPSSFRCTLAPRVVPPSDERKAPEPAASANDYCAGTINYLLHTGRPSGISPRPSLTENDGRFPTNPFTTIKRKAQPGGLDGLMIISGDTFTQWLMPHFEVTTNAVKNVMRKQLGKQDTVTQFCLAHAKLGLDDFMKNGLDTLEKESSRLMKEMTDYLLQPKYQECDDVFLPEAPRAQPTSRGWTCFKENSKALVNKNYERNQLGLMWRDVLKVRSDVAYHIAGTALSDNLDDVKRTVKITVSSWNRISYAHQKRKTKLELTWEGGPGVMKMLENVDEDDNAAWEDVGRGECWLNFRYVFILKPDPANRGSLQLTMESQPHIDPATGKVRSYNRRSKSGDADWGAWSDWGSSDFLANMAEIFTNGLENLAGSLADFGGEELTTSVKELGDKLKSSVVLPAATEFMFKGFDVDGEGNLYVGITYDTPGASQLFKKPINN